MEEFKRQVSDVERSTGHFYPPFHVRQQASLTTGEMEGWRRVGKGPLLLLPRCHGSRLCWHVPWLAVPVPLA